MRARCGACVFRLDAGTGLVAVFLYVSENWRCFRISKQGHQINEEIRDKEVRLVSDTGEQLGIMSAREALERAMDALRCPPEDQPVVNLSGGERRRTEIARCLAIDPKFIMLDEPFAGVDPIAVEDIQQIVWKLKDKNIGILITDHNVQETLSITDRAYLLFEGKILFQGTPEELAENKIVREKYLSNSFVLRRKDFQLNKDE